MAGDLPAVLVKDLTGRINAWIEVGMPDADRLHRGSKLAGRAAVYTHREMRQVLTQLAGKKIHRAEEIPIYSFDKELVNEMTELLDRRTTMSLSITERQLYVEMNGKTFNGVISEQRIP